MDLLYIDRFSNFLASYYFIIKREKKVLQKYIFFHLLVNPNSSCANCPKNTKHRCDGTNTLTL